MALERIVKDIKMHPSIWFGEVLVSPFPRWDPLGPGPENYVWMRKAKVHDSEFMCIFLKQGKDEEHFHYPLTNLKKANKKYQDCVLLLEAKGSTSP